MATTGKENARSSSEDATAAATAKASRGKMARPTGVWGGDPDAFKLDLTGRDFEQELGDALVNAAADPSDVKQLCERYGLRREDLSRLTGFSLRALADWSANKLPSEPAKRRLHEIRRLLDALAEVVKPEAIAPWLKQRNPAFDQMTPMQVIEVGEIDRLWRMVHHLSADTAD